MIAIFSRLASILLPLILVIGISSVLSAQETVRLAILPRNTPILTYERFAKLKEFIKTTIEMDVDLYIAETYEEHIRQIKTGTALLGYQNPIVLKEVAANVDPIFIVSEGDYKTKYRGVIIVHTDGTIGSIPDLKGKTVAYISKKSGGGYVSQQMFLKKFKIDLISDVTLMQTAEPIEENVIINVFEKSVDAGFISETSLHLADGAVDAAKIKVLTSTEWLPNWVFTAHRSMSPEIREKLQTALINLPKSNPLIEAMQVNEFIKPSRENMRLQ
jgi:phosphonate transport system substrate-binding protein